VKALVPSPTTGSFSPDEGIDLVTMGASVPEAAAPRGGQSAAAPADRPAAIAVRRDRVGELAEVT